MAPVALPGLLGEPGLPAQRNVIVTIGEFGHDRSADSGLGLGHQALQLRGAVGEALALGLQLLAVIELVFGGIGECGGEGVAHVGAAAEAARSNDEEKAMRTNMRPW